LSPPVGERLVGHIFFIELKCLTAFLHLFGGSWQRRRTAITSAARRTQCDDIIRLHNDFPQAQQSSASGARRGELQDALFAKKM
jgi:hypothetical protein